MVLPEHLFVGYVGNQVGFEGQVIGDEQGDVASNGQSCQLDESDPFQHSGVFVDDLTLFEIERGTGFGTGHLDEGLVQIAWVEDIIFQFEKPVNGTPQEFRMSKSVSDVFIFLFMSPGHIVLVTFGVVEGPGDRSVHSFLFPLVHMFEGVFHVVRGVGNEPILITKDKLLVEYICPVKADVFQFKGHWAILEQVLGNAPDPSLVRSVKVANGIPDFPLDFQVILEVIDDGVVGIHIGPVVVFIEF